jgi:hypothetical protein
MTYRELYNAFIDEFVTQSQDPLNACRPVNSQFRINNSISREKRKQRLKLLSCISVKIAESNILDCNSIVSLLISL